jgi:hypothetical protein
VLVVFFLKGSSGRDVRHVKMLVRQVAVLSERKSGDDREDGRAEPDRDMQHTTAIYPTGCSKFNACQGRWAPRDARARVYNREP